MEDEKFGDDSCNDLVARMTEKICLLFPASESRDLAL